MYSAERRAAEAVKVREGHDHQDHGETETDASEGQGPDLRNTADVHPVDDTVKKVQHLPHQHRNPCLDDHAEGVPVFKIYLFLSHHNKTAACPENTITVHCNVYIIIF